MKSLLLLIFTLTLSVSFYSQTILFSEDFEGENITDVTGISTEGISWTATCPNCLAGDIFYVDNAYGTMKGLRGNDTNGPATLTASGIDATGMYILILEFDYESNGYTGSGNLECDNECSGCSGNPEDILLGSCYNCWDFLLWELNMGTFSDGNIVLGNNCNIADNGHVISNPGCSSPYDANGNLIPGNDPANLTLNIAMAMWASTENMVIDNVVLTGYTKAEAIANGLISNPGTGGNYTVCPTGMIDLFDFITGSPDVTGSWEGPSATSGGYLGTIDIANSIMGDYYYIVSTGAGCEDTAIVNINSGGILPNASITGTLSICQGDSTQLTISGGDTYLWSNGSTNNQTYYSSTGQFYGIAQNTCGNDTAFVTINSLGSNPQTSYTGNDFICDGITTTITANGGNTYQWSDGTIGDTYITNQAENIYVIASNDCGIDTLYINILDQSVIAMFYSTPNSGSEPLDVQFYDSSYNATNYQWEFGNDNSSVLQNPTTTYFSDGVYTATLTASNAYCSDIMSTIIVVDDLAFEIPNVFTPNGDGYNDVFLINSPFIESSSGKIYNRWGQLLAEWNENNFGWKGDYDNKNAPDGTYFYIIDVTLINGETTTYTGSVMLSR